jgi:hypothetical protein
MKLESGEGAADDPEGGEHLAADRPEPVRVLKTTSILTLKATVSYDAPAASLPLRAVDSQPELQFEDREDEDRDERLRPRRRTRGSGRGALRCASAAGRRSTARDRWQEEEEEEQELKTMRSPRLPPSRGPRTAGGRGRDVGGILRAEALEPPGPELEQRARVERPPAAIAPEEGEAPCGVDRLAVTEDRADPRRREHLGDRRTQGARSTLIPSAAAVAREDLAGSSVEEDRSFLPAGAQRSTASRRTARREARRRRARSERSRCRRATRCSCPACADEDRADSDGRPLTARRRPSSAGRRSLACARPLRGRAASRAAPDGD